MLIIAVIIFGFIYLGNKLDRNNVLQKEIISSLQQVEQELAYNKITNRRLTDVVIHAQDTVTKLSEIKEDTINLRYYIGSIFRDELIEFAKKKEKGL